MPSTVLGMSFVMSRCQAKLPCGAGPCDQLCHANTEVVVEHQNFPLRDQAAVHVYVHGVAGQFIQRHHGAATQSQHVFQVHLGAAQFNA